MDDEREAVVGEKKQRKEEINIKGKQSNRARGKKQNLPCWLFYFSALRPKGSVNVKSRVQRSGLSLGTGLEC